ncbi:MAG: YlbF family regulator [Lachnospiraceae bacterium]|jgi:cell fate (sporulation/competence/biofilm development) regulator YlbF (YheA/YmcA/DUF963 family)|nr:YlbF family regulator [Lachnospiraceae bacterium]
MFPIEEATIKFAADIRETLEYEEYWRCLNAIKQEPKLYEKVNEYRVKNFHLQTMEPTDILLEKMESLQHEYEEITENPLVDDFLRAELSFCRLMQDINKCITMELEFE